MPLTSAFKPWAYTRTSKGVYGVLLNGALFVISGRGGGGGGAKNTYHRNKKALQTSYIIAVLIRILFEFTRFFNLQNVVKQLFQERLEGGLYNRMHFSFTGRWAYNWREGF